MSDDEELLYGLLGTQFNVDADIDTENRRQKLKRKAIDDEVTDEKGRALRFHGAFTGGFHAGYFNTVGSKEGFIPQQYISQGKKGGRSIRQYKPEDFMDEEDFSEHGIAPKLLKTKAVFDDEDIRKHFKQSLGSNSIIGDSDILKDILVPQKLTIGMVLLKKLGYVASLGVGDKENSENSDNDDNFVSKKMEKFDYEVDEIYQLVGQMNKFGLGYSGINRESRFPNQHQDTQAVNFGHKGKRGIKGTAFGVGVDEDEEDLEDLFGGDSMTKYNFEIVEDDDKERNFGWTAPKKTPNAILESGAIVGFQLSKNQKKTTRIIYEPPNPPRFFNPIYPIRRDKDKKISDKYLERPKLMPDEDPKSVFNLISLEDRERLMNITQEQRVRKSSSRWGDVPNVTSVKFEESNSNKGESDNLPTFYKPKEKAHQQKKGSQKTWSLTSNFGSMFKSAGKSTETQDTNDKLNSLVKSESSEKSEDVLKIDAANLENYGFLTRKILRWHPDKLLCKRFNIADPYPGYNFSGVPDEEVREKTPPVSIPVKLEVLPANVEDLKVELEIKPPINITSAVEPSNPPDIEVKTTVLDVSDKPAIDLFKSVFADSDAEFSSSDEEITETVVIPDKIKKPDEPQMSIVSSLEQALNVMIGGNNQPLQPISTSIKQQSESGAKIYGPSMPPGFVPNSVVVEHVKTDINSIISKNIKEPFKDPLEDLYDFKEKSKVKKSKKDKKSKKKKSKKKKSH